MRYAPDATLNDWAVMQFHDDNGPRIYLIGFVQGDAKCRWPDGRLIATSLLEHNQRIAEGTTVRTTNSVYLLGNKRSPNAIN